MDKPQTISDLKKDKLKIQNSLSKTIMEYQDKYDVQVTSIILEHAAPNPHRRGSNLYVHIKTEIGD